MQAGRNGHLGLGVYEFEARLDNCLVALLPAFSVRQQVLQAGTVGEALDAGNLLEGALFLEHGKQLFEKRIVTEEALPFEIAPGRVFKLRSCLDEPPVFCAGAVPVESKVFQNPVHGQELRHLVESGGSPVAGPRILLGILDHAGPHGIEHDIPAHVREIT